MEVLTRVFVYSLACGLISRLVFSVFKRRDLELKISTYPYCAIIGAVMGGWYYAVNESLGGMVWLMILTAVTIVGLLVLASVLLKVKFGVRMERKDRHTFAWISVGYVLIALLMVLVTGDFIEKLAIYLGSSSIKYFFYVVVLFFYVDYVIGFLLTVKYLRRLNEIESMIRVLRKSGEMRKIKYKVVESSIGDGTATHGLKKLYVETNGVLKSGRFIARLAAVSVPGVQDAIKFVKSGLYSIGHRQEKPSRSLARKNYAYKLLWVFVVGCFIGFVVEIVFCYVRKGYVESRQGMLYGPFNQVYGFGAVVFMLLLDKFDAKKITSVGKIFFICAAVGGVYEALCSLLQEKAFGSVSWDYAPESFGILGGRTSLVYMAFWGVLGVVLIKFVLPALVAWIERIPNAFGATVSVVALIFFIFDGGLTIVAYHRWNERHLDNPPKGLVGELIDRKYDDEYMSGIYPNSVRVERGVMDGTQP